MPHPSYPAGRDGTAASWPDGSTVVPDEFSWLALTCFQSIGETGGTYNLTNVLTLGGAGVAFTTVATSFYGITCSGSTVLTTLGVSGATGIDGTLTASGDVLVDGGTSGTHATLTIGSYVDSTANGAWIFNNTATFNGNVALVGSGSKSLDIGAAYTTTVHGTFTFAAGLVTTSILCSGAAQIDGGIRQPIQTITSSGAITAGTRYVNANIAAGGFVTLPSTGHPVNSPIEIMNSAAMALEIRTPAGTTLAELTDYSSVSSNGKPYAIVYYDGSSWVMLQWRERLS